MKIERDGKQWRIKRSGSIFTFRNGKEDVWISVENDHGAKEADGKYYSGAMVLAAESGEVLRHYVPVPKDLTVDFLKQAGFVDA